MKPIPAAKVLTEFGVKPSETDFRPGSDKGREKPRKASGVEKVPTIIEETYTRGVEDGRTSVLAEMESKLEEMQAFYEQKLDLERCTWVNREATKFAEEFDHALQTLNNMTSFST